MVQYRLSVTTPITDKNNEILEDTFTPSPIPNEKLFFAAGGKINDETENRNKNINVHYFIFIFIIYFTTCCTK